MNESMNERLICACVGMESSDLLQKGFLHHSGQH